MSSTVATLTAALVVRALPRQTISRLVGNLCERPIHPLLSRAAVGAYRRAYHVDMSEVVPRNHPYASFDDFFTRPLVQGARSWDNSDDVVSPADGSLQSVGRVEPGCRIVVKGKPYDVARLIGDDDQARGYIGGQFAVVYLSPRDYHRVHAPVAGEVVQVRSLPGDYYPVNAIGERWVPDLLVANRRVAIVQNSPLWGPVTTVMVAAMVVGRITVGMVAGRDVPFGVHSIDPPVHLAMGDEIGAFHLGSTAVVLVGSSAPAWQRTPGLIRVGRSLTREG